MKIILNAICSIVFIPEEADIGQTFKASASSAYDPCPWVHLEGPNIKEWYKILEVGEILCSYCEGTGHIKKAREEKMGLFKKRRWTEELPCSDCGGTGKHKQYKWVSLDEP